MKYRIIGELYSKTLTAAKVQTALVGYDFLDATVTDAVDEDGKSYVLVDATLSKDVDKNSVRTKLENAISAYGITGRLTFHECLHMAYETDGVAKPCVGKEVILGG